MLPGTKSGFELDARLESNSVSVLWLGLCELRLIDDSRWLRLLLIPQRSGVEELHDLTPLDQAMLTFEISLVSKALRLARPGVGRRTTQAARPQKPAPATGQVARGHVTVRHPVSRHP